MFPPSNYRTRIKFISQALSLILPAALASTLHAAPGWTLERFNGISGAQVSNLTSSPAFYSPSLTSILTSSAMPSQQGDNFGTRIRGYVIAPVSGLYTFWASGDDAVTLMLSPDENPANKQVIAFHVGWTAQQEWTKYPTQKSRQISLLAGSKYYIEVLHKEGSEGDNLAIAWTTPVGNRSLIPLSALETYDKGTPVSPAGMTREFYAGIAGPNIADLVNAPAFRALPTTTGIQSTGMAPSYIADSYGVRLRGYITPQVSGNYTFWESGDDHVELYLSPSDNPADKRLIASHKGWTDPLQWEKYSSQKSIALNLTAGRSYYIEVLHKEGGQGDHLAIAWTPPNASREILPSSVMNAWVPAANDADGDMIPDEHELAWGLNPADRADAISDVDSNSISNLVEYRGFSNPALADEVAGHLLDEIWLGIPGDKLNHGTYKTAATRHVDVLSHVTTTQAYDVGEDYIRRIRGYITAPVTGAYQFWGTADDDVDFHLSTSSSKFQLQHIIRSNVLGGGTSFDIDPSQKSALITLTAGQKYYFELWHKEGRITGNVALAWKAPTGSRELIPSFFLTSYGTDPDDKDDDGLSDTWELANGLSIIGDGRSTGSKDGAYGDLDGDGLINLEEFKNDTKANLIDTDGDGVSDYDEVHFFDSATLANDIGAFIPVATLAGDAYTSAFGEWEKFAGKARQSGRRGSVTYPLTVTTSGIHALKFTISSILDGAKNEQHDFHIKLNGHHLAYKSITILPDGTSALPVLTPWLQAGVTYNLELFVDNSYNWRRVSIDQLEILAAGGTDSNANNTPDWTEIRVNDLNGLDTPGTIHSRTSPAVIEGKAKNLGLLSTNAPTPIAAPNGRFFTEVPLAAGASTGLNFSFENNALAQSSTVHWLPTNLKTTPTITIRQGDSLLLTAFDDAENASLETYTYTVSGSIITNNADQPTAQLFVNPGIYTISTTHTAPDGTVTPTTTAINVLAKVTIDPPVCMVGYRRIWTAPILPATYSTFFDSEVNSSTVIPNTYSLETTIPVNQPMIVKTSYGLILGSSYVKSAILRSGDEVGYYVSNVTNTEQQVDLNMVVSGDFGNTRIKVVSIIGGLVFTNNTTSHVIDHTAFDANGVASIRMLKNMSAHGACHTITCVQKNESMQMDEKTQVKHENYNPEVGIDLQIADGQGGKLLPPAEEETPGAFTVANLNDTDGDGKPDISDDEVTGEVDLMELKMHPPENTAPEVECTLTLPENAKLYKSSDKKSGEEINRKWKVKDLPQTRWVELKAASSSVRTEEFKWEGNSKKDLCKATGLWAEYIKGHNAGNQSPQNLDEQSVIKDVITGLGIEIHDGPNAGFTSQWGVSGAILHEFKISPNFLENENKVKIDITRIKDIYAGIYDRTEKYWNYNRTKFTGTIDLPNDDISTGTEEDIIPKNGYIYSVDSPVSAIRDNTVPNGLPADGTQVFYRGNFTEFVRVAVGKNASRPTKNVDADTGVTEGAGVGSRVSNRTPWILRVWGVMDKGHMTLRAGNTPDDPPKPIRQIIQASPHESLDNP